MFSWLRRVSVIPRSVSDEGSRDHEAINPPEIPPRQNLVGMTGAICFPDNGLPERAMSDQAAKKHRFARRTFLRGVGVTMALPWLESLPVWGDEPKGGRAASEAPVRLAV